MKVKTYQSTIKKKRKRLFRCSEEKKVVKKKRSAWTQLDMTMSNYQFPEEWSKPLQETIMLYFRYMEEKKGSNWGSVTTIKGQMRHFKTLANKFTDKQIIDSIHDTTFKGNVTINPQWLINRKQKEQDEQANRETV